MKTANFNLKSENNMYNKNTNANLAFNKNKMSEVNGLLEILKDIIEDNMYGEFCDLPAMILIESAIERYKEYIETDEA